MKRHVSISVIFILFLTAPFWLHSVELQNILILAGIYAIAAVGLDLLMSFAGQISLGHAGFMAIGAYSSAITTVKLGWPPLLGLILGLMISLVLAFLMASSLLRLKGFYIAMATIAFSLAIQSFLIASYSLAGGSGGLPGIPDFSIYGWVFDNKWEFFYLVSAILILSTLFLKNITNSRIGRGLISLHGNESSALALGIPATRLKLVAFLWSVGLASVAGTLLAHFLNFVSPGQFGLILSIDLLIMMLLGGPGTLIGAFIGAVLWQAINLATEGLRDWRPLFSAVILGVLILYLPNGVIGGWNQLIKKVRLFYKSTQELAKGGE